MDIVCTEGNKIVVPEKLKEKGNFAFRMAVRPFEDRTEDSDIILEKSDIKDMKVGGEDDACVASKRHLAERASIEKLVKGTSNDTPVIKTRTNVPGKMVNIFLQLNISNNIV